MNKDEILNMPAGREMDALIREKIFRRMPPRKDGELTRSWLDGYLCQDTYYSTDISAAWEVVEKQNVFQVIKSGDAWMVRYHDGTYMDSVMAPTAPLAICRAALLAVMEEPNE